MFADKSHQVEHWQLEIQDKFNKTFGATQHKPI